MRKGYVLSFEAFYKKQMMGRGYSDEIQILVGGEEDSKFDCEFSVRWYMIGNESCPKIEMFHDAWKTFDDLAPMFKELSYINPRGVVTRSFVIAVLEKHGFKDETQRDAERGSNV